MILIGCPVYKRDWILGEWFAHIEKQTVPLSELGFIFELGPNDDATHNLLWEWHLNHPEVQVFDAVVRQDEKHKTHPDGKRIWRREDYLKMATIRNHLLDRVTCLEPDKFFSLDSDILLTDPRTIEVLCEETETKHAVCPLLYMWPDNERFPSVMSWTDRPGGRARRKLDEYPLGTRFRADVIMAAKMMRPEVYSSVRYAFHPQGEDLGWSADAHHHGYQLWSISDIYVEHIMNTSMLQQFKDGALASRAAKQSAVM